jgi:hypothetical protein
MTQWCRQATSDMRESRRLSAGSRVIMQAAKLNRQKLERI